MHWILLPLAILSLLLFHVLTITVHELGHAITARILTKEKVVVYLGSHGNQQNSTRLLTGNLEIWVRVNPLKWSGGLCLFSAPDTRQHYNIILAGPLASLLLFVAVLSTLVAFHPAGLATLFLAYLCIWSALIFLFDMIPSRRTITLERGDVILNDGAKLKMLRTGKMDTACGTPDAVVTNVEMTRTEEATSSR